MWELELFELQPILTYEKFHQRMEGKEFGVSFNMLLQTLLLRILMKLTALPKDFSCGETFCRALNLGINAKMIINNQQAIRNGIKFLNGFKNLIGAQQLIQNLFVCSFGVLLQYGV